MRKYCFAFIICCIIFSCARQGKKYFSDGKYYADQVRGYGISDLFRLTGDSVYGNDRKPIHIKVPAITRSNGSAWGSIYSGAAGKTAWDLYFIISDFDSTYSAIIFDKNKNCDFTDDTAFTIQKDTPFIIAFRNPQDQRAWYRYTLIYRNRPVDSSRQKIHQIMTYKIGTALPATYMLLAKPFNIRKVKLTGGNIVSLKDADSDGMFTGKFDKIVAGDLEANPGLIKKPLQCKDVKYGAELPFGNNTYKLISVDKYGNHISLIALNKKIDTRERLTSITVWDENGNRKYLTLKSDKQYSVFYVWGTWCIGCLYQSKGFAELINECGSKANFYTLNAGDTRERMEKYIADKRYPFQPYQINKAAAEKQLFAEAFPTFIVADKDKKILLRTSFVDELKRFLHDQ